MEQVSTATECTTCKTQTLFHLLLSSCWDPSLLSNCCSLISQLQTQRTCLTLLPFLTLWDRLFQMFRPQMQIYEAFAQSGVSNRAG